MPLPKAKRVVYRKNLLDNVICQLRFPPILTIETTLPDKFQEAIRDKFPGFRTREEPVLPAFQNLPQDFPAEFLQRVIPDSGTKSHEFTSDDKNWAVKLTRTFISLTTKRYPAWESFKDMLTAPLEALIECYHPAYFSRIGLRYIDIVKRSELGLQDKPWADLLDHHILGLLASPDVKDDIQGFEAAYEVRLDDERSIVRIRTGLVQLQDTKETAFLIDSDFHDAQRVDIANAISKLDYFHDQASRLIQLVMSEILREAMGPENNG